MAAKLGQHRVGPTGATMGQVGGGAGIGIGSRVNNATTVVHAHAQSPQSSNINKTAAFGTPSISLLEMEELNRKTARKCINCCTIVNDINKNDMAKVAFSVNLKTSLGQSQKDKHNANNADRAPPDPNKVLMSALQAMDVMFQMDDYPQLKELIKAGSMCHDCTKMFGNFFQLYLQFISASRRWSPIRTLLEKNTSITRNLKGLMSTIELTQRPKDLPKPKESPLGRPVMIPHSSPNSSKLPLNAVRTSNHKVFKPSPNTSAKVSPKTSVVLTNTVSPKAPVKSTESPSVQVISPGPPPPTVSVHRAEFIKAIKHEPVQIFPKPILLPKREISPTPTPKEPEKDPLADVDDEDLQSMLLSRGRKQQFTKVRDFDEPVFEDEVLSQEQASNAASAVAVVKPKVKRVRPAKKRKRPPPTATVAAMVTMARKVHEVDNLELGSEEELEEIVDYIEEIEDDGDEEYKPGAWKKPRTTVKSKRKRLRKNRQTKSKVIPRKTDCTEGEPKMPVLELAVEVKPTPPPPLSSTPEVACSKCSELFQDTDELAAHIETHVQDEEELKWACMVCNCGFKEFEHKSKHMIRAHQGSVSTRSGRRAPTIQYGCGMCTLKFSVEAEFKEHLISSHFSCPTCVDDTFNNQDEINEHMDSHGVGWAGPRARVVQSRLKTRPEEAVANIQSLAHVEPEVTEETNTNKIDEEYLLEGNWTKLKLSSTREPQPCPICGKVVIRVVRHIQEVHEKLQRPSNAKRYRLKPTLQDDDDGQQADSDSPPDLMDSAQN